MDTNEFSDAAFLIDFAEKRHSKYIALCNLPWRELHDTLLNNPILHENFVISDVFNEFRYLDV